jgi:hypothetical protein
MEVAEKRIIIRVILFMKPRVRYKVVLVNIHDHHWSGIGEDIGKLFRIDIGLQTGVIRAIVMSQYRNREQVAMETIFQYRRFIISNYDVLADAQDV